MTKLEITGKEYELLIINKDLQLRQMEYGDAEVLFKLVDANREYLGRWLPWVNTTRTAKDTEEFINSMLEARKEGSTFGYGIIYQGNVIGHASLMHLKDEQEAEIGYWVSSTASGKGIATKTAEAITHLGFNELKLPRIVIKAQPDNAGSNRVAEKLGFKLSETVHDERYGHVVNVWITENPTMKVRTLATGIPGLLLVPPKPERDASFAVQWFENPAGKETLLRMGNPESRITPTTLDKEMKIINEFIELAETGEQLTWMMRFDKRTIGAIWIVFKNSEHLPSPHISIMIGDPSARGKGIGLAAMNSVIAYVKEKYSYQTIYARHLTSNVESAGLLHKIGFENLSHSYADEDGLEFQNVQLKL